MRFFALIVMIFSIVLSGCKTVKQHKPFDDAEGKMEIIRESKWGGHSTINGVVKDLKNGQGIPMAQIIISNRNGNQLGALSDEKGRFIIKNIPNEYYRLTISAMDYERIEQSVDMKEGGLFSVEATLKERIDRVEKPVIYLYPEQKQEVRVRLDFEGYLTHTYPKYTADGWNILAEPNGTLTDTHGLEYYALFWEAQPHKQIIPRDGFIIAGKETAPFLEEKLSFLGLNRREANEFIMHWLPQLESNPFNLIHFAGKEYEEKAKLKIIPEPETVIRVMMLTTPLQESIDFPVQNLKPLKKIRKGFTVVEWGGSILQDEFHSNMKP
jgi:hypothetical protein